MWIATGEIGGQANQVQQLRDPLFAPTTARREPVDVERLAKDAAHRLARVE